MPEGTGRFAWVVGLAFVALVGLLAILALLLAGTIALAIVAGMDPDILVRAGLLPAGVEVPRWTIVAVLSLAALAEILAGVWTFVCYGVVRALVASEFSLARANGRLGNVETLLEDQAGSLRKLTDLATLSDQAKSLIFREHELETIRETIQEDLIRQDYKTAELLIDSIEAKLGYADEAARLRRQVAESRKATIAEKIDAAVGRVREIIERHDWPRARRESQRLVRLFPDAPHVAGLPEQIETAHTQHKRKLLQDYGEAVRKNDLDRSIEMLKELDLYLTPQEAAALQESARGVFKARLHQLGVQFAICVTDSQWDAAIEAGRAIVKEFPNTRMATEVREKMAMLRTRAAQTTGSDQ